MACTFVNDGNILWLEVHRVGAPAAWTTGYDYQLGDVVIPRFPVLGQADIMFQVAGFIGSSGLSEPSFPAALGGTVEDGGVVWSAVSSSGSPPQLPSSEYYIITESVTAV